MRHPILPWALPLLLALPALAQSATKKPEPAKDQKAKAEPVQRPKDDGITAKDAAIVAIDKFIATKGPSKKQDGWRTALAAPPKLTFDVNSQYEWHLKTNKGLIKIKLLHEVAPMHVSSTIYLARLGFYDNLKFHRVITRFMAQGGCPLGTGTGSPGYKYDGEFDDKVRHDKPGLLSMANAGPGTDGSQFFLTFVKTPHLDGKHTIFGEVTDGMDVVEALEAAGSQTGRPTEDLAIEMSWIVVAPAGAQATPEKGKNPPGKGDKKQPPGK